ncbi:hypothetical protein IW140_002950 [Coemansia sp. RSA 1813]|nr:hypothetical protein EV178_002870 [Coemansia sp. RSA 1646]KAJ1771946.1 hypothetical protein LPJ74_001838 [Coemansia sp. RSA 1843]KAJ2089717.1 hypothetical protein IW138_003173 [Coemansia sp. RSA 986]KAJ2214279.1 hypothetical protein EV179_003181 [Coemansia sp. RSA 487]KAJ2569696.1 hypothetical protein IW140_002950 [Coemansia sp. RSA 1813]
MFIRPKRPQQEPHIRHTLDELGYEFNMDSGHLVNKSTGEKYTYNQPGGDKNHRKEVYELLIHSASREVYNIITGDSLQMHPIAVPDPAQPHCNIYVTRGALSKKHLVVLIVGHGNFGAVWGWNILVKCGLKTGSVISYIRGCIEHGFGVMLLNPNENIVTPDGCSETFNSYMGRSIPISGSETPNEHVGYVWRNIIRDSDAKSVAFVSHGSAGTTVVDLLKYDFTRFTNKVACAAFIDSTHSTFLLKSGTVAWLRQAAKQWETSNADSTDSANTTLSDRLGCLVVRIANDSDFRELTPSLCMGELLNYIDSSFKRGPICNIPEMQANESLSGGAMAEPSAFDSSSSDSDLDDKRNLNDLGVNFIQNTYNTTPADKAGYVGWG